MKHLTRGDMCEEEGQVQRMVVTQQASSPKPSQETTPITKSKHKWERSIRSKVGESEGNNRTRGPT